MSEPNITDDELENLMAELETQNAEIAASQSAATVATPAAVVEDEPAAETPPEEPAVEEAATVEASEVEAAPSPVAEEDELAALEAELEAEQAAPVSVPAPVVAESIPVEAVESLTKNGTAIDDTPASKVEVTVKVDASEAIAALREIETPPAPETVEREMKRQEPKRPTETTGAGNLQHYVDVDQFREDTRVTEINLDKCMIEQAGLRAYYGATAARAEAQAARVKAKFEVVEATLYDHHRKELAKTGEKTTEKMVENAVKLDPRWIKAKNMVIEAETIASINKGLVESLKDRRDMIIQLGADRRDEYKGAARVLAEQGQRDELRDRAVRAMQGRAA